MKTYVEAVLHTSVSVQAVEFPVPLYLKGLFQLETWKLPYVSFLVAHPRKTMNIQTLIKHKDNLERMSNSPVAFAFEELTPGRMRRMIEENVPFITKDGSVYLPFLGTALTSNLQHRTKQPLPRVEKVSPQTQRFILKALYQDWDRINITQAAETLGVTKMTLSRVFDELEAINPNWIERQGKTRWFCGPEQKSNFWTSIRPHLFNPVVREYRVKEHPALANLPLSGMSALSEYTMIGDGRYPSYAATKKQAKDWGLERLSLSPDEDEPDCIIQVMRYDLDAIHQTKKAIDPLSAILSLTDEENDDPRVEKEVDILLEKVWNHEFTRTDDV